MVDEIMNNPNLTISQKQSGDLMWFRGAQMVTIQTDDIFFFCFFFFLLFLFNPIKLNEALSIYICLIFILGFIR